MTIPKKQCKTKATWKNKIEINFQRTSQKNHSPWYWIPVFYTGVQSSHLLSGCVRGYLGFFNTATGIHQSFGWILCLLIMKLWREAIDGTCERLHLQILPHLLLPCYLELWLFAWSSQGPIISKDNQHIVW